MFVILQSERNNYGVKMRLGHSLDRKQFFLFSWRFEKAGLAELVECAVIFKSYNNSCRGGKQWSYFNSKKEFKELFFRSKSDPRY